MGSYAELRLGHLYLGSTRDDIDPGIMALFRESDKRLKLIDRTQPELFKNYVNDDYEGDEPVAIVRYVCSVRAAKDRLDLMGFTRQVAEASFYHSLQEEVARYESWNTKKGGYIFQERLSLLRALSVEDWLGMMQQIWRNGMTPPSRRDAEPCSKYSPLLRYMLCEEGRDWYGFPGYDYRHFIRLLLDVCPNSEELVYDLTDLVLGGWVDEADDLIEHADELLSSDFIVTRRLIILTEGDTDSWILERSLNILYPHLVDYFHFFDFKGSRAAGGAGELSNIVKAFAAAWIVNRVIAVFDNDTAAKAAINSLSKIPLPKNIVVRQYPDIPLADNYLTLGPTGKVLMNVNGLAGSIELYLGEDILRDERGDLAPIHWRGYDKGLGRYQGEILNKSDLQARFDRKLKLCEADRSKISSFDWDGIHSIIDTMRTAFHETDSKHILSEQAAISDRVRSTTI